MAGRTYPALNVLHPKDRPTGHRQRVATVRMPVHRVIPARLSRDTASRTRWCLCCDTVLPPKGRSPLCDVHRAEHRNLDRQRRNLEREPVVAIDKAALIRIHTLADLIVADLGELTIAYNTGRDLRTEMDRAMLDTKRLINYVRENVPDPRPPA